MIYRRLFDVPTWRIRSPLHELEQTRRLLDRLYEDVKAPVQGARAGVFPLINLTEDVHNYYVRAELPGVKSDELDIQVTGNNLGIFFQFIYHFHCANYLCFNHASRKNIY